MDDEPTEEDVTAFVIANRRFLSHEAEEIFRQMSKEDQRYVIKEGSLSNCRDPVAIIRSRAWNGCLQVHRDWMEAHQESSVDDLIDAFMAKNSNWINEEAEELLRSLDFEVAWKVVDFGSMYGCRDSVAIVKTRIKDAKAGKKVGKGFRGYGPREGREGREGKGKSLNEGEEKPQEERSRPGDAKGNAKGKSKARRRPGKNGKEDRSGDPHEKALHEERSLLCLGLPALWTTEQTKDFFSKYEGEVEAVYMGGLRGKGVRTSSIDFTTAEGARNAALACDRMEIKDGEDTFYLICSIRYKVEGTLGSRMTFPGRAGGEGDGKLAQSEGRSVYLSKIPLDTSEEQITELIEDFGEVEAVYMLPSNGFNMACFVSMVSPGEAAFAIRGLNNAQAFGTIISASYPIEKNLKRKKPHPEDETIPWYPVELRNFPHWTLCDDIKATILSLGPASQRVRVIHYDPEPSLSVARAYFREEEDRDATLKALAGHEISPGYILNAAALPRTPGNGPGFSHTPQPSQPLPPGQPGGSLSLPSAHLSSGMGVPGLGLAGQLASAQPLKLPDSVSSNSFGHGPHGPHGPHGCSAASSVSIDQNSWNGWTDWNGNGWNDSSTWLPAAFVQR